MLTVLKIIALVILGLIAFICHYKWKHQRIYELVAKMPQVEGQLPLLGIAHRFISINRKKLFFEIGKVMMSGPSPRTFNFGPLIAVVVDDPDQVEKVLLSKHCLDRPLIYRAFVLEKGLVTNEQEMWKAHRKILEPAFNTSVLRGFFTSFNEKSRICMKNMEKFVDGPELDIFDIWLPLSLDGIVHSMTGFNKQIQLKRDNKFLRTYRNAFNIFGIKLFQIIYHIKPLYKLTNAYRIEQKLIKNGFMKTADEMISEKEEIMTESSSDSDNQRDVLSLLLNSRDKLTHEEIRDELNTFIVAGTDTFNTTISMACLLAAMHPHVQEKIRAELQRTFETADEEVTEERMKQLSYLSCFIKESMRFCPAVGAVARTATQDIELGGYTIPAGVDLVIPIMKMHANKEYWGDDADEFKPERFEPQNFEKVNPNAFIPFLRGPRNCIGFKYGMNSMKVSFAHFFRNYKLSTSLKLHEIELDFCVNTRVVQGYMVKIERVDFKI